MLTARRLAGAFVAVLVGVTLVALATLLVTSGRPLPPDRLAAAAVVVAAPVAVSSADPFPPPVPWSSAEATRLARRLADLPGVAAAVPDRTFYAQAVRDGRPDGAAGRRADAYQGHGWSSARLGGLRLSAGAPPVRPGEVVVDRALGLSPGSPLTLLTATGPAPYTVSGTVDGPGFHVADEVAAVLAPGVDTIGLVLAPDADPRRVAAAARAVVGPRDRVVDGTARGGLEPRDDARVRWIGMQVLTATATLAGFVTVFVVGSTFAFVVAQRRRELALLRVIGATPRQVSIMVYREALAVGAIGSLAGTLLGAVLAPAVGRLLVDTGFEPATFAVRYTLWPLVGPLAVGPVVGLAGAWSAARRAARVRPLEAQRAADVDRRPLGRARAVTGGCVLAAGAALAIAAASTSDAVDGSTFALYGVLALVTGTTALAPAVVGPLVRSLRLPGPLARRSRSGGAVGLLVRGSAGAAPRRTASTAAPVLLVVAFAVLVSGLVATSTGAYATARAAAVNAGWIVAPDRAPGLSDRAVERLPVGAALLPTTVFVDAPAGPRPLAAHGVDPAAFAGAVRRVDVVAGSLDDLRGPDVVVATASVVPALPAALVVVFADGERVALRVVAVVSDASLPGDLLLPRAAVRTHDPSALTTAVHLRERTVPPPDAGARVVTVATWAAEADRAEDRLTWLFTLLLVVVTAGYGAIAVANTLHLAAAARVPDLRVLRLVGATRRQVLRLVAAESALVVLVGAVLGGAVAFAGLLSVRAGLSEQIGRDVDLVVPWPVIGGAIGLCLLLAVVASVLPARAALGRAPAASDG